MEDTIREIADFTSSFFDVVGITGQHGHSTILVVGLESTPERNLDQYGRTNGKVVLSGFEKYMSPLLESAVSFIKGKGYKAEPVGRYGYPLQGQLNLKELAVQMGLGQRGKHSVVLHDKYGPRLRFAAIQIGASFHLPAAPARKELDNPTCQGCTLCLDVCPVNILKPYKMTDTSRCLSRVLTMKEQQGHLVPCDECLKVCPAGTG
ncbi:MAG TPA: 4Fe-4S double cluster binding domain-containing protein [Dehalococcoidales bacterium]|nr:4Fe-4S double cluster binding domain-containing protein [Dehalococcoidales bacterium]